MTGFHILVNDPHLSDRPPSSCTDSYTDDLFGLLGIVAQFATKLRARSVVFSGDLFHSKIPWHTSHRLVRRFIEYLCGLPCPALIVPGNHDMCVSADTEALTDRGWRRLDQLEGSERFATLNPDGHVFEWRSPDRIFVSQYNGDMIHFAGRRVDHLVTPEHDVYVRPLAGGYRKPIWRKRKAQEAPNYNYWIAATAAQEWRGAAEDTVKVPASRSGRSSGLEFSSLLAAQFFGWYLSEGSVEPWRVIISQSRRVRPDRYQQIVDLLKAMGLKPQLSDKTVRIGSAALSEYLEREFGNGSRNKRIPAWVKNWPPDLLQALLGTYLAGDGTPNGSTAWTARTASERLADDLQEIGAKIGIGVTISAPRDFPVGTSGYVGRARTVGLTERADVTLYRPKRVPYRGLVWCPSVPNGLWMVRRNGRALWTGNSHDRLASLDETQPLGTVLASGAGHLLHGWSAVDAGIVSDPIYGVPWLGVFDDPAVDTALADWRARPAAEFAPGLVVAHAPLYPPGLELPYEYYPAANWAAAMGRHGSVHYGHVHEPHGVYTVDGVQFSNPGALSRGSLHEHNLTRAPAVAVFDSGTGRIHHVTLPHKPASAVFRLAEITADQAQQASLDAFVSALGRTTLDITSIEAVIAAVRQLGVEAELVALVEELLAVGAAR